MKKIDERYESFKQKVSSYIIILAILVALFSLFLQSLIKPNSPLVIFFDNPTNARTVQIIFFVIVINLFLLALILTVRVFYVFYISLNPLTLQTVDTDSVIKAKKGKTLEALKTYLDDALSVIRNNDEAVRNRMSNIYLIGKLMICLLIFYIALPIAYFSFVFSLE